MATSNLTKTQRRKLIWKKTNGICAHCGKKTSSKLQTIDHIMPKAKGGGYDTRNLLPLCKTCNGEKADIIMPLSYYSYTPEWAIEDFNNYRTELEMFRTNALGEYIMSITHDAKASGREITK